MGRWPTGSQERLQDAAIELFSERGYEHTTVAHITEAAGLTERTFYNHFADKREVLFPDQKRFVAELAEAVRAAPADQSPLDSIAAALLLTTSWFDQRHDAARRRRTILDTRAELRERELAKMAALEEALAGALRERGGAGISAALTAAAAVGAYRLATAAWLADPQRRPLEHHLKVSFEGLRTTAMNW
ncbi:helix-turn-helix domain-containing protein [Kribbella sp. NPDC056861]|uniref:TetR/AcrR family transcriptional regulator n=1 Tax=Kribbella sp. NPDC056861 TaxID=3154857 RepID=UPI00344388EC